MRYKIVSSKWRRFQKMQVDFIVRDEAGKKLVKTIDWVDPYFYVKASDDVDIPQPHQSLITSVTQHSAVNGEFMKITVEKPNCCFELKKLLGSKVAHEIDVPYTRRIQIDNGIFDGFDDDFQPADVSDIRLKKCYIDIECDNSRGFPEAGRDSIWSIAIIGEDEGDEHYFDIKSYHGEKAMLRAFFQTLADYDLVFAWYASKFDFPYIETRCEVLGIRADFWKWRWCDLKVMYEKVMWTLHRVVDQMPTSYSLEAVSTYELGHTKNDLGPRFHQVFLDDPELAKSYNLDDCRLMKQIDDKRLISDIFIELGSLGGIFCDECIYFSKIVDTLVLRKCYQMNYVLPSKARGEEGYQGAHVLDPVPGVHKNVMTFDFQSMYPSIIRSFNISFDTLMGGDIKIPHTDVTFSKTKGMIPILLEDLGMLRKKYKKELEKHKAGSLEYNNYHIKQYTVKTVMNTFYGFLGFPSSRIFDLRLSGSVTAAGRWMIDTTKEICEKRGYVVLYGDTDSVLVIAKKDTLDGILEEGKSLESEINSEFAKLAKTHGVVDNYIDIEFEKIAKIAVFFHKEDKKKKKTGGLKKKYILKYWWVEGQLVDKVKVSGLEFVRGEWSKVAKLAQRKMVDYLLAEEDPKVVRKYLMDLKKDLFSGKLDDQIILYKTMKDPASYKSKSLPAHVVAAQLSEKKNIRKYLFGEKVDYVICGIKEGKLFAVPSCMFPAVENKHSAYLYIWIKQVKSVVGRFMPLFGINKLDDLDEKHFKKFGCYDGAGGLSRWINK